MSKSSLEYRMGELRTDSNMNGQFCAKDTPYKVLEMSITSKFGLNVSQLWVKVRGRKLFCTPFNLFNHTPNFIPNLFSVKVPVHYVLCNFMQGVCP